MRIFPSFLGPLIPPKIPRFVTGENETGEAKHVSTYRHGQETDDTYVETLSNISAPSYLCWVSSKRSKKGVCRVTLTRSSKLSHHVSGFVLIRATLPGLCSEGECMTHCLYTGTAHTNTCTCMTLCDRWFHSKYIHHSDVHMSPPYCVHVYTCTYILYMYVEWWMWWQRMVQGQVPEMLQ